MSNFACQACLCVWPPRKTLRNKHISQAQNVCQAYVCVVPKLTNIVLDRQNFKCLPNNACSFGPGVTTSQAVVSNFKQAFIQTEYTGVILYIIKIDFSVRSQLDLSGMTKPEVPAFGYLVCECPFVKD